MKRVMLITLVLGSFCFTIAQAYAGQYIRAAILMYDESHFDPVSFNKAESLSGAGVNLIVMAQKGITFGKVKAYYTPQWDPTKMFVYDLIKRCDDDSLGYDAGEAWLLSLRFWGHTHGQWKVRAYDMDKKVLEERILKAEFTQTWDAYYFPPKPTNASYSIISGGDYDGWINLSWDASVGPPQEIFGTSWKGDYQIASWKGPADEGCSCAIREVARVGDDYESGYDKDTNRVYIYLPPYMRGCQLRIENILWTGGVMKWWQTSDPWAREQDFPSRVSRANIRLIIP